MTVFKIVRLILFKRDFESDLIRQRLIDNWRRETLDTSPFYTAANKEGKKKGKNAERVDIGNLAIF